MKRYSRATANNGASDKPSNEQRSDRQVGGRRKNKERDRRRMMLSSMQSPRRSRRPAKRIAM